MNADKQFKVWMRTLIVLFIAIFAYIITADRYAPITTEGRVQGYVIQVAPEVSGKVIDVFVENNQLVAKGTPLFKIDARKYKIALEEALLALQLAQENEETLYANRAAAISNIKRAEASYDNAKREYQRLLKLSKRKVISQSQVDNAEAQFKVTSSTLDAERQKLKVIETQLGQVKGQSTPVLTAENRLRRAELDLSNTVVKALSNGVVTNLQLEEGVMANPGAPLMTFVSSGSLRLGADFREKSVANVDQQYRSLVAFDAYPGDVFEFSIASKDYGVSAGQQQPNGSLTTVETNNRWVRDAQRTRINLASSTPLPQALFIGSRATVVLYPSDSAFWSMMAQVQIRLASWFHFIY